MRTHIGCMTSKFAWQLSDSIWITYWTIGHLGSLEVWYLINHLNCLNFISIAYLINFGSNAEKCGGPQGVKLYWFIFSGPKCSPMQGGLWWNWYLGKRAHPNVNRCCRDWRERPQNYASKCTSVVKWSKPGDHKVESAKSAILSYFNYLTKAYIPPFSKIL